MTEATQYALNEHLGLKLTAAHKAFLGELARRRGCSLSDLAREALIGYFNLSTYGSQPTTREGDGYETAGPPVGAGVQEAASEGA